MGIVLDYLQKVADGKNKTIEEWLYDAAENAENCSLATHVGKFSHPDAKVSVLGSTDAYNPNGYMYTSNVGRKLDILAPAQYIGTARFLLLEMEDQKTVIEHMEIDSDEIRHEFSALNVSYDIMRNQFLKIKKNGRETDERVKQVYFPVAKDYHLLSLMTSSGLLMSLKERIEKMRTVAKLCKDNKEEKYGQDYDEIYNITEIGFGGTKPLNISTLNAKNYGRAFLLQSLPPKILPREVIRPRTDFFSNTLYMRKFSTSFQYLNTLFKLETNNLDIRNKIKSALRDIIDEVMVSVYKIREIGAGWSEGERCLHLPIAQKIWLDNKFFDLRLQEDAWLEEVSLSFARWMIRAYESILKENKIVLSDAELSFLRAEIESVLAEDKGCFR